MLYGDIKKVASAGGDHDSRVLEGPDMTSSMKAKLFRKEDDGIEAVRSMSPQFTTSVSRALNIATYLSHQPPLKRHVEEGSVISRRHVPVHHSRWSSSMVALRPTID
jgi:hypothetical protein